MYVRLASYLGGMEIWTIVIANIEMLHASLYDFSCDVTNCALIVRIDQEWWYVFAVYIPVELWQPLHLMEAFGAGDILSIIGWHSDDIMLSRLPWDSSVAEMEYMTTWRFAVGSIIGPIRVWEAGELIIAASATAAAEMQLKVGCGFDILQNSFDSSEMAGERAENVSVKCSHCEWDIRLSCKYCVH